MCQRFVAGSAIGALVVAVAAFALVVIPGLALRSAWSLTLMWCFVPVAWGIWAQITPRSWVPGRLPLWGAILGFLGGMMNAFVLNLPSRVLAREISVGTRWALVAAITVAYYLLWMLVRSTLVYISPSEQSFNKTASFPEIRKAA